MVGDSERALGTFERMYRWCGKPLLLPANFPYQHYIILVTFTAMDSDNDTKPRVSIFKNKKVLFILIPILVLLCCGCTIIFAMIGLSLPPELQLRSPNQANSTSTEPSQSIKLGCTNPQIVTINGKELTREEIDNQLCGSKGYTVNLNDGDNSFKIVAKNTKDDEVTLEVNITFDKTSYDARVAQEEKQRLEEEKRKQDEDAKKKAEVEAEKNKPKVGDSLLGVSYKEIKAKYEEQDKLSTYKGDQYLESLKGQRIVWIGEIGDVDEEIFGDELYISVHINTGIIQNEIAFVENPRQQDLQLNKGTKVKLTATISKVDEHFLGLMVYVNSAVLEKVD